MASQHNNNGDNILPYAKESNDLSNPSDVYDSDTSLDSDTGLKQSQHSFINFWKSASNSKYSPIIINEEIHNASLDLEHPPNDKRSFIWGALLMFVASFLFSISTTIIKWNHSFGRESFEIFVFRMFIQLFVTTMVASISVVMNHHYCYENISDLSGTDWDEGDTETEFDHDNDVDYESDAELGEFRTMKHMKNHGRERGIFYKMKALVCGKYKFQKPWCQVQCVYTKVFWNFWKETSSTTKLYILARGFCGGTGAVCYYWAVDILPINDTIMIISLFPIFSTFFSWMYLGEKVSHKHMFCLLIAMCGILLMCYPSFIFGRDDRDDRMYNIREIDWTRLIEGYGYAFIGSICYGFVFVFIRLAYKAPTFSLIFSNGMFGLLEAILICVLFHRFVPIPIWSDWLIAIGIGCIGYLAQNAENRSGKYIFASLASLIRITEVFWEYVWQNMIYSQPAGPIASVGAGCLAFSIIAIMIDKYNDIKEIEISEALEGVKDYETEYDTDYDYDYDDDDMKAQKRKNKAAKFVSKLCGPRNNKFELADMDGI